MGEEGILMCFAFFSDTKVGMHRTSGSFTSQIAMRYRTFQTLHCLIEIYEGFELVNLRALSETGPWSLCVNVISRLEKIILKIDASKK